MRFQGVRASAQSAKRASASGRSRDVGLHSDCLVLARAFHERKLLELGLVLPERSRYREPTATKSKAPSVFGWREVMDLLEPDFRRDRRSRDRKMSHQNAIREGPRIRPALNSAHGGGFRCARKRPDVIDSKWSGREDLNLRPPGPEFAALPCLPFVFNDLSSSHSF